MELLSDMGQLDPIWSILEAVLISAQDSAWFALTWAQKLFWSSPMILLGNVRQVEARFGPFEDSVDLNAR
jgi:hypothetical protein